MESIEQPLLGSGEWHSTEPVAAAWAHQLALAAFVSLAANILLAVVKAIAAFQCGSVALLGTTVDSLATLISQATVALGDYWSTRRNAVVHSPPGRLGPAGVLCCACIIGAGALVAVNDSVGKLTEGLHMAGKGMVPSVDTRPSLVVVAALAALLKVPLYWWCRALGETSAGAKAVADDHLRDAVASLVAFVAATVAAVGAEHWWWADCVGGIALTTLVVWRGLEAISLFTFNKSSGVTALPDMLAEVRLAAAASNRDAELITFLQMG